MYYSCCLSHDVHVLMQVREYVFSELKLGVRTTLTQQDESLSFWLPGQRLHRLRMMENRQMRLLHNNCCGLEHTLWWPIWTLTVSDGNKNMLQRENSSPPSYLIVLVTYYCINTTRIKFYKNISTVKNSWKLEGGHLASGNSVKMPLGLIHCWSC